MGVVDAGKQILIAILCWVQEDMTFACRSGVAQHEEREESTWTAASFSG